MAGLARDKKVKQAEKLRKKYTGISSLFWSPDFYSSAELFLELANEADTDEDKERFYNEAATTFLLQGDEYGHYRAAEIYKSLRDQFISEQQLPKSVEYGKLYAGNLECSKRFMMAGQAYFDLGVLCEGALPSEALGFYKEAISAYEKDGDSRFHMKKACEKKLLLELSGADYSGAICTLANLDVKYAPLCRQLLLILLEQSLDEELDDPEEHKLVMALINRNSAEATALLETFINDNFIPKYAQMVFESVLEKLNPENDIC